MSAFSEAFADAIAELGYREAPPERRMTPDEVSAEAMRRSGASSKRERSYKSARRSIERRRTTAGQTRGQRQLAFTRRMRQLGLRVHCELDIDPSPDPRNPDMRPRTIDLRLSGGQCTRTADELDRGDVERAAGEFLSAMLAAYGLVAEGGAADDLGPLVEVQALDLGWGDGSGAEDDDDEY